MSSKGKPPKGSLKGYTCETKWCRNQKSKQSDGYFRSHCWKCRSRWLAKKHPAAYFLNTLRASAKKRNLTFNITLDQFKCFCNSTGFLILKGQKNNDATIDRIRWNEGYTIDNIRVLDHGKNSRQGAYNIPRYLRAQIETLIDKDSELEPF